MYKRKSGKNRLFYTHLRLSGYNSSVTTLIFPYRLLHFGVKYSELSLEGGQMS